MTISNKVFNFPIKNVYMTTAADLCYPYSLCKIHNIADVWN